MNKTLLYIILSFSTLYPQNSKLVKISNDISHVDVVVSGKKIRIHRIEDTANKLTDDFSKTSRTCPPFCIQPIKPVEGIKNIEELELIDFIKDKVSKHKGLIIDARTSNWYKLETIPTAINIPYTITQSKNKSTIKKLFKLLGAKQLSNNKFNFTNAKYLAVFCNGVWCAQSPTFIKNITNLGYPKEKIYYYRSGMQGWKLLGLTTEILTPEEVK